MTSFQGILYIATTFTFFLPSISSMSSIKEMSRGQHSCVGESARPNWMKGGQSFDKIHPYHLKEESDEITPSLFAYGQGRGQPPFGTSWIIFQSLILFGKNVAK